MSERESIPQYHEARRVRITFECEAPSKSDVAEMYDSVEDSITDVGKGGSGPNSDLVNALADAMCCTVYSATADIIPIERSSANAWDAWRRFEAELIADLRRVYLILEDANFHEENEVVARAIAALGGGKAKP